MTDREAPPIGLVLIAFPDGVTSCSWGGVTYQVQDDGSLAVPAAAVADLIAHGFAGVETTTPQPVTDAAIPRLVIPQ